MEHHHPEILSSNRFDLGKIPKGKITRFWLHLINNGLGEPIRVPILIARGNSDGPVIGLNAALHGNELNGINVVQKLFKELDLTTLKGTVIGILAANVPGVLLGQRRFNDNFDLNRQAPGSDNGTPSRVYIHRLIERVISKFDYLIDLHTTGRNKENCWHIRAEMDDPTTARLARLLNPEVIIDSEPGESSLRGYCSSIGIKSLTLELKDPMVFQKEVVADAVVGIRNVMIDLGMTIGRYLCAIYPTVLCHKNRWTRSDEGGVLSIPHNLLDEIKEGEKMAEICDIFGEVKKEFFSPLTGIVLAKNINPICQTGMGLINIGYEIEELESIGSDMGFDTSKPRKLRKKKDQE
ncbi:MAG: succinylglutamate desuccinylase/aspartoacylase family protein [Candidatus Kapaibacteriales bacterium]